MNRIEESIQITWGWSLIVSYNVVLTIKTRMPYCKDLFKPSESEGKSEKDQRTNKNSKDKADKDQIKYSLSLSLSLGLN